MIVAVAIFAFICAVMVFVAALRWALNLDSMLSVQRQILQELKNLNKKNDGRT